MKSEQAQFKVGQVVITPGASAVTDPIEQLALLRRHARGDWGIVSEDDAAENELSVTMGYRILSAYITKSNDKVWIITEADRESTTILLPSEY